MPAFGQASGTVVGTVVDASGARAPGVAVTATNRELGIVRSVLTNATGAYTISALQPGNYEISAELAGFNRVTQRATVNVGRDLTVDFRLDVGAVTQTVEVAAEATAINMVDSKVDAIISQDQIQDLPLIGRNAYEMAKLVPGVQVSSVGSRNREFNVSIAGATSIATRFTIDGLVYNDMTVGGGVLNLSQEMVQEFQVSVNNGDASMGMAQSGAINLVTRSGGNQIHGSAFGFFRDDEYAAFPGLQRPVPTPNPTNNPQIAAFNEAAANPNFYRRQYGGLIGGPIRRDRLFWLASMEHTPQLSVQPFDANLRELQTFNTLIELPRRRLVQNYRVDWRANDNHSLFWRYTWDRVRITQFRAMPSTTSPTLDRTYAAAMGWTQVWSPSLVNDLRLGFSRYHRNEFASEDLIREEARLYAPALPWTSWTTISGTQLIFGLWQSGRTNEMFPRAQIVDNLTYIRGKHTWRLGLDVDRVTNMFKWPTDDTYTATLFNPTQARQAGISVPDNFATVGDLMQLPLNTIAFGVGNPQFPDAYFRPDNTRHSYNFHFYGGSTYRATPSLTLNWALAYS
ncbi:MAG: carboxypeptidase regulatory-like domain-containing protein, partial [Terriglobia bacterium]